MSTNTSFLETSDVIPDVLPQSTKLSSDLIIRWPDTILDSPGLELGREETQPEPTIQLKPLSEGRHSNYVLIMTDPDLMSKNDQQFGQVRHWLATNISVDDSGKLHIPNDGVISPYIGPAPLPNYLAKRPHRYIFILAEPKDKQTVTIESEDLIKLQTNYSAAFEGAQDQQDLKDRWGFNAQKLLEEKGLEAVAVTFMFVAGTIKSAAENITMTAQAGVNKVLGK
ncbi:hypothetical protein TWF694_004579 [Orbilia ellipsospora]|uniref:PEBP-like protein n=1 Tax=Orbilia ellipsospora TaxID=2528407 RepID=A0AAV9WWJ8_9PEZI